MHMCVACMLGVKMHGMVLVSSTTFYTEVMAQGCGKNTVSEMATF